MVGGRRTALMALAVLVAVLGLIATYVRVELAKPGPFADRAVAGATAAPVRAVIAEQVAVRLLERRSPDLVATRPLVLTAIEAVLETQGFERVLRRTAITAHGVLLEGDEDVTVELEELRGVLLPALRTASPELARAVPTDLRAPIAQIRRTDAAAYLVRAAEGARWGAYPLLALAALAALALVAGAGDRRRAAGRLGIVVVAGAALAITALAVLEAQVVAHAGRVGVVPEDQARAAVRAMWGAFAGDLQRLLLIFGAAGLALWGSVVLTGLRLDRSELARKAADVVAGDGLPATGRFGRGLGIGLLGAVLLLRLHPLFEAVSILAGVGLLLLGLTEAVATLRTARRATPRTAPRPRRVLLAVAGGLATAVAVGVVLLVRASGTPAPLEAQEVTRCNGLAELCDRRLDQVVLAGTHNSMSAADRPGWLFANQRRPIPRQLEDGIRLLMVDPHYGRLSREGRVRTDLEAEGTTRNRVAAELGADALGAAERLAGRVGLVPEGGKRGIYLCHSLCELGAEGFGKTLKEIRGFLERNRSDVLVVFLESSVKPEEVVEAVEDADLGPYLATLPRTGPLPTLRRMISSGRRLVVLDEGDGGSAPWYQPAFVLYQATSIDAFTEDPGSCKPGQGSPDDPLLIADHWVDRFPPPAAAAARVNRARVLERRVASCRRRLGRTPNAIAVDFYDRGDLLSTVRRLNRRAVRRR